MSREPDTALSAGPLVSTEIAFDTGSLAAGARVVAFWSLASRLTGFLRVAALAAVLGPTFFGNLFQTALYVPYVISELLAASLIPPLLAPRLVRFFDADDRPAALRVARGLLGAALPLFAGVALLAAIAAPALLLALTVAVDDPEVREKQISLGWPLLVVLLPQVVLYAVISTAVAVQHAHRRFALPTAAQIIENIGLVIVLVASALVYGFGADVDAVTLPHVLAIGLGSTLVVGLHAAVQWWGAARLGFRLFPTAGWRSAEVRSILRSALPATGAAGLGGFGWLAMLVASGQIPGGAVALQNAQSLYNLPVALFARPLAVAQLPLLSSRAGTAPDAAFRSTFQQSLRLTLFVTLPASFAFLGMPEILAGAVSFGEMATPGAITLISTVLLGLGVGLIGEAILIVASSAAYARLDASSQFLAALIRMGVLSVGIWVALRAPAGLELLFIGLAYSLGTFAAATYLGRRLRMPGAPSRLRAWTRWLSVNVPIAAEAVAPAVLLAQLVVASNAAYGSRVLAAVALVVPSVALYLLLQRATGSSELRTLFRLGSASPVVVQGDADAPVTKRDRP